MKSYHATIFDPSTDQLGERVAIQAEGPLEAKRLLGQIYGKGCVFDVYNEEDANKAR